eukprot:5228296-Amphidinium_carterae.1
MEFFGSVHIGTAVVKLLNAVGVCEDRATRHSPWTHALQGTAVSGQQLLLTHQQEPLMSGVLRTKSAVDVRAAT